jgi:hypothetical protein
VKHRCPYCEWTEFSPAYWLESSWPGWLGWLVFRRVGKVVVCARCASQFGISSAVGVYRLSPTPQARTAEAAPNGQPPAPQKAPPLIDEDQARVWAS